MTMTQPDLEKIKELTREFFKKTGLEIEALEVENIQGSTVSVNLKMPDPQILIGEQGQALAELQRLLKIILRKRVAPHQGEPFYIDVDINDYKKKKTEYLKDMARSAAEEVVLTKKEKELPAMPAYERRIIHLELAGRGDVATESIGQEPERKITIRPYP